MKFNGIFGAIICSILALTATSSCKKEDKIERFPEGTSMIRMMNEDNGGTKLGNTSVYITSSGNFRNSTLPIFDCGKKDGIGDIGLPDFMNMAPEVAVTPGHGYVICDSESVMDFPSRKKAIREDALMYRVYVDSWIQKDGKDVGANVYFLLGMPPESGQMPKMGSSAETLRWDDRNNKSGEFSIKLPSEDIETEIVTTDTYGILKSTTHGKTLTFRLSHAPMSYEVNRYTVRIRSGRVYTEIVIPVDY